ncbi:MAG TPA: hypothetical protein VMU42_16240 [Candidatus Sulfotelmatobacter sp.]|nr:hypothetical protein [Candidatus Sulfotelmatobacter sp.]
MRDSGCRKFLRPSLLARTIATVLLALVVTGCVVEAGVPHREHWHGWHEWR